MSQPKNTRRILKWRFKLKAFDITYRPRTSIRSQVLADFIAERPDEDGPPVGIQVEEAILDPWTLFTDGSSCLEGSGAGLILTNPERVECTYSLRFIEGKINGSYVAKEQHMIQYLEKSKMLFSGFKKFSIEQVSQSETKKADALSKFTSTSFAYLTKQVLVEVLKEKSIGEIEVLAVVKEEGYCWMTPLLDYLIDDTLPTETKKARTVKIKSRQYAVINGVLYRKSFLEPWLWCVGSLQAEYVIRKNHEGSCSIHSGAWSVVAKAIRSGYYWPTMHKDARGEIISDNGKQFIDNPFKAWCEKLNIKQRFPSVKRPQTNGHVKRANRSLGEGIKARHTPFSLTYGTEAVISVTTGMPSLRCEKIDQTMNEVLLLNLDILEEEREKAAIQESKSKAKMERYYNAKVRGTTFKPGDFVYRSNEASHAKDSGKLGPKWEGPYEVVEALGKGAYKIRNNNGDILTRTWNDFWSCSKCLAFSY
ncbi:reverse transcriptase domain-containing protein [Tanacetum coccineum]